MRRWLGLLVALGAAALLAAAGTAALAGRGDDDNGKNAKARLDGYNEVVGPGSISTVGHGSFSARIDEGAQTITYELTYTLENTATQSHIHFAQKHVGGNVIAFLCGGGSKPACPAGTTAPATVTGVIVPSDVIGPASQGIEAGSFGELVRAMRAGATYANVHSSRFPAGEIRGQIRVGGEGDDNDQGGDHKKKHGD